MKQILQPACRLLFESENQEQQARDAETPGVSSPSLADRTPHQRFPDYLERNNSIRGGESFRAIGLFRVGESFCLASVPAPIRLPTYKFFAALSSEFASDPDVPNYTQNLLSEQPLEPCIR